MSKPKSQSGTKAKTQPETCCCPFCSSGRMWEKKKEQYSDFFAHFRKARVEVLKAFRSLLDDRISALEQEKKKVTKLKVE